MKKTYSTPIIEVEKFDVIDVLTTSATLNKITKTGTGDSSTYEVEIKSKW